MDYDASDELARRFAKRLRTTILRQLGLGAPLLLPALACTSSSAGEDEAGVTTNPSGSGNESQSEVSSDDADSITDSGPEGEGEVGSDDDTPDPIKLDLSPKYDVPPQPEECWSDWYWDPLDIPEHFAECSLGPFDPNTAVVYQQFCVAKPEGGECADICVDGWCEGMDSCLYGSLVEICGEFEIEGECCILAAVEEPPPIGRPFVVDGRSRLAAGPRVELDAAAAHWLETAQGEHASIAAFARFVASLLRFGAPASLLADALAAASDEARHTRDALALASRFAGRELELGALAVDGALGGSDDLEQAIHDAVLEGCIGETLAAHEAACLAARAEDPEVAEVLARIADDEARHAGLAWRFVAWAIETRPDLRSAAARAFDLGLARSPAPRASSSHELLGLGCPPADLRARWRELGLRELVSSCAKRLLATPGAPKHSCAPPS